MESAGFLEVEIFLVDPVTFGIGVVAPATTSAFDLSTDNLRSPTDDVGRRGFGVDIEGAVLVGIFVATAGSERLQRTEFCVGNGVGDFAHDFLPPYNNFLGRC